MDAKLSSPINLSNPSGKSLLVFLAGVLVSGAAIFDWTVGKLQEQQVFLTLPLLVCTVLCVGLGYLVVPILRRLKAGQTIREDGPQSHLKKSGTPTMGGIFFVPVAAIAAVIWSGFEPKVLAVATITLAYGTVGWLDDWQILRQKSNKGISPRLKLILQIGAAIAFCLWMFLTQPASITNISLPFQVTLTLGWLFWPLAVFIFAAESNATNFTDGVDGLAGGTGAIASLGLAALIASTYPDLAIFSACLAGSCLGFVWHNRNPATVFMGDTGSLALGGALAAIGLLTNNLWSLFVISGIFFIESLSVIAQVSYYKATKDSDGKGKRLFKMAPVHHHLELSGWTETQVVGTFYLINAVLVVLCLMCSI
ncbi:MAG: phospho-N-acetylmuramoyl-pentapeptide-transferase [Xenococcaceae cyanobacterium]